MVNQILAHISNTPTELIGHTQDHGILVEAYSPIAHGELMKTNGHRRWFSQSRPAPMLLK